jgi:hypothetical protein
MVEADLSRSALLKLSMSLPQQQQLLLPAAP